jgi:hypothetical protein
LETTEPTVHNGTPFTFVRNVPSPMPSDVVPINGYGIGSGLGAAGVKHTLTAIPVTW